MAHIIVLVGHARTGTYCDALAASYARGAAAGGHEVTVLATATMTFDPVLHEGFVRVQPLEPDLSRARDAIMAADHLVVIFPLWLGDMPAILKGFLERVFQPDLVGPASEGRFVKLLAGKSARVIMTMGMPGLVYRWYYGAHALKLLRRNILEFLGVKPVRATIHGSIEAAGPAKRERWLKETEQLGYKSA